MIEEKIKLLRDNYELLEKALLNLSQKDKEFALRLINQEINSFKKLSLITELAVEFVNI